MFKSLIVVFAVFSLSLAGDLKLSCDVEPAWIPAAASSEYRTPGEITYCATSNAFCLTLKPAFAWRFLYGNIELTAFSAAPKSGISFFPFRMSYSNEIGLKYQFSNFTLSGGWLHNCQHMVAVGGRVSSSNMWNDIGYDKVFVKFSFSNHSNM